MSLSTILLFGQDNRVNPIAGDGTPRIAPRTDLQWGRPLFHAPEPPAPKQRLEELRFNEDFRNRDKRWRH